MEPHHFLLLLECLPKIGFLNFDKKLRDAVMHEDFRQARKRANELYSANKEDYDIVLIYALLILADSENYKNPENMAKEADNLVKKVWNEVKDGKDLHYRFAFPILQLLLNDFFERFPLSADFVEELVQHVEEPEFKKLVIAAMSVCFWTALSSDWDDNVLEAIFMDLPKLDTAMACECLIDMIKSNEDVYDLLDESASIPLGKLYFRLGEIEKSHLYFYKSASCFAEVYLYDDALKSIDFAYKYAKDKQERFRVLESKYEIAFEAGGSRETLLEILRQRNKLHKELMEDAYVSDTDLAVSKEELEYYESLKASYLKDLYQEGELLAGFGAYEEAITIFQRILKEERDNPLALESIAFAYYKQGDLVAAQRYAQQAMDNDPYSSYAKDTYIRTLAALNELDQAIDLCKKSSSSENHVVTVGLYRALEYLLRIEAGDEEVWDDIVDMLTAPESEFDEDAFVSFFLAPEMIPNPAVYKKLRELLDPDELSHRVQANLNFFEAFSMKVEDPSCELPDYLSEECYDYPDELPFNLSFFDYEHIYYLIRCRVPEYDRNQFEDLEILYWTIATNHYDDDFYDDEDEEEYDD